MICLGGNRPCNKISKAAFWWEWNHKSAILSWQFYDTTNDSNHQLNTWISSRQFLHGKFSAILWNSWKHKIILKEGKIL